MTAALGPFDVGGHARVRDRGTVVVGGERRSDPPAVLADDRDGQPARGVLDVGDALVDRADCLRLAEHEIDLMVERTGAIEIAHAMELGDDAQPGEE